MTQTIWMQQNIAQTHPYKLSSCTDQSKEQLATSLGTNPTNVTRVQEQSNELNNVILGENKNLTEPEKEWL